MTQKNPSGNLQGQPLRPVHLRTGEHAREQFPQIPETPREEPSFARFSMPTKDVPTPQQPVQENNAGMLDTTTQKVSKQNDISTLNTMKHAVTSKPSIPTTPVPQSDLAHNVHVYSNSAKLNAFAAPQSNDRQTAAYTPNTPNTPTQQQFSHPAAQPTKRNPSLSVLLAICVGLTVLPLPFIAHVLIDQAFGMKDGTLVFWLFALVLGLLLLQVVLQFMSRAATSSLQRSQANTRLTALYERVLRMPRTSPQTSSSIEQVLSRLNAVTTAQEAILQTGGSIAVASIITIIEVGTLFLVDWRLAGATILVALLYMGIGVSFGRSHRRQASQQMLESYSRMNDVFAQGLAATQTKTVVPFFEHIVQTTLNETAQRSYQHAFERSSMSLTLSVIRSIGGITLFGLGGYLLLTHVITNGQLAAFVLLLLIASVPLTMLTTLIQQNQVVVAAEERVTEILK